MLFKMYKYLKYFCYMFCMESIVRWLLVYYFFFDISNVCFVMIKIFVKNCLKVIKFILFYGFGDILVYYDRKCMKVGVVLFIMLEICVRYVFIWLKVKK